ncbi:MAG: hypothetical protein O7D30_04935, partial [Rickettsia endosymbiont of Ixodes persulcatus]|nr:hypothetical protein [Rickettsia endosymbiont of Ixodes persulcatus]
LFATEAGANNFLFNNGIFITEEQETEKGRIYFGIQDGESVIVEVEIAEKYENTANILIAMASLTPYAWVTPEWLYFLKMSHRYKKDSPHFWKTRLDIEAMRQRGIGMPEGVEDLFKERERLTYTNKLPKLNQGSDTFFKKDDGFYVYDHDSLHVAVKLFDKPAYTYYMQEGAEVMTSREKFFACPLHIQLAGTYEESCVLALERSLVPFNFEPTPEKAFNMALSKVCTSITSGYFREFSWENCLKVMEIYRKIGTSDYVERFHSGMEKGLIKPFKGEMK